MKKVKIDLITNPVPPNSYTIARAPSVEVSGTAGFVSKNKTSHGFPGWTLVKPGLVSDSRPCE